MEFWKMPYKGSIVFDNRTSDTTVTLGVPTVCRNAGFPGPKPPIVIQPVSGEQTFTYILETGLFTNANEDMIQLPITIEKNGSASSSGYVKIVTADGTTSPNSVVVQISVEDQVMTQMLGVNSLPSFDGTTGVDDLNFIFTDSGQFTKVTTNSNAIEFIVDKAIGIAGDKIKG
jgi:hypothetical protein